MLIEEHHVLHNEQRAGLCCDDRGECTFEIIRR
jgi:hypothetical protein